jgi:hypothetical protein
MPFDQRLNDDGSPDEPLTLREHLSLLFEGLLFLTEAKFDEAIVGVADRIGMDTVVVYDTTKIIDILEEEGMDREEATEYYEFNIIGAYVGTRTPMFISLVDDLAL